MLNHYYLIPKRVFTLTALIILSSSLLGCDDTYHEHTHNDNSQPRIERPRITDLELIDTNGQSSNIFPYKKPIIDPYQDLGYFELWWDIETFDDYNHNVDQSSTDYRTTLYVNEFNSLFGAITLDTHHCGLFEDCHHEGFAYCSYTPQLTMSCSTSPQENRREDISPLIYSLPQELYLILEVCNTRSQKCDWTSQLAIFH